MTSTQPAWGLGVATLTEQGQLLDVWFPAGKLALGASTVEGVPPNVALAPAGAESLIGLMPGTLGPRPLPGLNTAGVHVVIGSLADAPRDGFDVWLRLHLLSYRL